MTQTPGRFDPSNPDDALHSEHPAVDDARAGSPRPGYGAEAPAGSPDLASGAPAAAPMAPQADASRAATPETPPPAPETRQVTRAGMVWAAVACALVVLILLIAFILQNQEYVQVKFFGLEGSVPLGIALFIAAVGGGVLVAIAGAARIIQLRLAAHRQRVSRRTSPDTRTR
ncbi:LapA family protein [Arthrobacter oryzae]|uniref:Putative integral membrane protein n=1 Tax=Arthrobacter oryzae TaxID=409290 RepID=A0A495FLZ4_9MICC|nr:lipopolysaccharide assembly protein LapA domain-containing protein [Arthrobacter oryzae]RKR29727.1 putative integral membrane protein [Arthrobacter oryzae]